MNKVFAVGVGPGSPKYVTDIVKEAISQCDVVIGYGYTIKTIEEYVKGKKILEVTMQNQEEAYQEIAKEDNHTILVPFTGDVNFSESEVVDRLIEIYDEVEIIPGISSTQVAASRAKVPTDKSKVITMHISTAIEDGKEKKYDFSIVQDWVKYPIKDPTKYLNVDWKPCIEFIKSRQRVTK